MDELACRLGYGLVPGSFQHNNELQGSIKRR